MKTEISDELTARYESVSEKLGSRLDELLKGYAANKGESPDVLIQDMEKAEIRSKTWCPVMSTIVGVCVFAGILDLLAMCFGTLSVGAHSTILATIGFFSITLVVAAVIIGVGFLAARYQSRLADKVEHLQFKMSVLLYSLEELAALSEGKSGSTVVIFLRAIHDMAVEKISLEKLGRMGHSIDLQIRRLAQAGENLGLFSGKLGPVFKEAEKDWARRAIVGEFMTDFVI